MQNLKNKVGFITGGSKGIGYGIAEMMIKSGMNVVITGRDETSLKEATAKLEKIGGKNTVLPVVADVRNFASMSQATIQAETLWGKIDVVVANAGVGHFESIEKMTEYQWQETIDINLTGVFHTIKSTLDSLKRSKGYFISIASLAGINFFAGGAAYNASKFGLVGFTQAIMLDLRSHGIKVSTIMPGSVATYFNGHEPNPADAWKIQPQDIGQIVIDLLMMNPRTLPSKIEVRPLQPGK